MGFDTSAALSGAASGALAGAPLGPVGIAGGALIGLAPSLFKLFSGASQKNQANQIQPYNPGYQINNQVLDNARILGDRYNNYTLPGYTQAQGNINNTYQNAYSQGVQGATSGADVADLAAKLAYGKNVAQQNLTAANAQGKDAALQPYLEANAAAGQQFQNKNEYDNQQYQQQLRQKAALIQAGNTNEYNALDTGASVLSAYLNPKSTISFGDDGMGKAKNLGSIFASANSSNPSTAVSPNGQQLFPTDSSGNIDFAKLYQRYPNASN